LGVVSSMQAQSAIANAPRDPKKKNSKIVVKFTHSQLEKEGVIMSSDVPEDRRSGVQFAFSSTVPAVYDVNVSYKTRPISTMTFNYDELLEKQHNNELELEVEFLKLNVNLLLFIINKNFA